MSSGAGVKYDQLSKGVIVDNRYQKFQNSSSSSLSVTQNPNNMNNTVNNNSTVDALHRLAAGLDQKSLADKFNDPNRPTWEQYKKDNESRLNALDPIEMKEMAEYRHLLDMEREHKLAARASGPNRMAYEEDSDDDDMKSYSSYFSSSEDSERRRKRKEKKKAKKEAKRLKKNKKKKSKKERKEKKKEEDEEEDKHHLKKRKR